MVTTIQIGEHTLLLIKKLKAEYQSQSYDQALQKVIIDSFRPKKSLAGSLKKYFPNYSTKKMVEELQNERRSKEWERF